MIVLIFLTVRLVRTRAEDEQARFALAHDLELRIGDLARVQAEMTGRVQGMGELLSGGHAELARTVNDRLDAVTRNLGLSMEANKQGTVEGLHKLHERLLVIDRAQSNITDLAAQVTSLREVLSNKQTRGAFGQAQMEMIVQDGLAKGSYEFQYTLSNGSRPDCVVFLPDARPLVIDAKFPLEAVTAFRDAQSDDVRVAAARQLRQNITTHVSDIARKYLIPGETQELALMFVPSESVYSELHNAFDDIVQKAFRARVVIVSPTLLMLAIHVIQQIQRDARMREAADKIHAEVGHLMDDLKRLNDRVYKLQQHFSQANEDVRQIVVSAEKIERRGTRIREVEFDDDDGEEAPTKPTLVSSVAAPR
ncbi:MAG: DNA recombination protein RmuC [Rhizobiales bacterium]|nr:DNA recombination protein RmuC [Hyphomicrobiales bacterium]